MDWSLGLVLLLLLLIHYIALAGYPLRVNHQCVWFCMKSRIIILIIIIISLGQILLSYIANTSRTHTGAHARAHMRACTHTSPPYRLSLFVDAQPWRPAPLATMPVAGHWNKHTCWRPDFWMFSANKKIATRNWDSNSWQHVLSVNTNS